MNRAASVVGWIGTILISLAPGIVALDSGGVLVWSYWAIAASICIPVFCVVLLLPFPTELKGFQPHALAVSLLALGLFSVLQASSLPSVIVGWGSAGSHAAWTEWLPEFARPESGAPTSSFLSISVAPSLTLAYASQLVVFAAFAWCGALLFNTRERIGWLLVSLSVVGALHASIGIWQVFMQPQYTFWGISANHPFGVFINRNNASYLLNLSLASSIGLLGWRLAVVTGHEFGERGFSFTFLIDLASDRVSILALLGAMVNAAGLLACGSRAGLAGAIVGVAIGMGMFRSRRILPRLLGTTAILLIVSLVLLIQIDVNPRSLERFGAMAAGMNESLLTDGRFQHWSEAMTCLPHYQPLGAGLGTYRYAYLPYQQGNSGDWFIHADNLWLELALEGGVVGALLLLCCLATVSSSLLRLRETPDPMDHGLATAGWIALGAMITSQFFDFGLTLAGNGAYTALLFGVIMGRASTEGVPSLWLNKQRAKLEFGEQAVSKASIYMALLITPLLVLAISHLSFAAHEDAAIRTARIARNQDKATREKSILALEKLEVAGSWNADIPYERALLIGIDIKEQLWNSLSGTAAFEGVPEEFSGETMHVVRRLRHEYETTRADSSEAEEKAAEIDKHIDQLEDRFEDLYTALNKTLALAPLHCEARIVYLDYLFSEQSESSASRLAQDILKLRRGSSNPLLALATRASEDANWELVNLAMRSVVDRAPRDTERFLSLAERLGHPTPLDIVSDDIVSVSIAAQYQIRNLDTSVDFSKRAIEILSTELPESRVERAHRYKLIAGLYDAIGEPSSAEESYVKAIEMIPGSFEAHIDYADALARHGKPVLAKRFLESLKVNFGEFLRDIDREIAQLDKEIEMTNNETVATPN